MGWLELLEKLGVFGIAAWLVKALVGQGLSRDIERFKRDLRAEAFVGEIMFSRLHERRANAIADLYSAIADVQSSQHWAISNVVLVARTPEQFEEDFSKALRKSVLLFKRDRILFPLQLATDIDAFFSAVMDASDAAQEAKLPGTSLEIGLMRAEAIKEAWKIIRERAEPLQAKIEAEFRRALGVSE